MASTSAVNAGSQFCRDCGGTITERGGLAWCENTTANGDAVDPKDICRTLRRSERNYCEYCREPVEGEAPCKRRHTPSTP